MPSKRCCRSCPRCDDCPVLVAAAARARRRDMTTIAALVDEVFAGLAVRRLPDSVTQTLEALDSARRRPAVPAATR
ncbi:MAG TPA: hypothetical protein VK501_16360 [Baekduia sp.]|uniref:hypothetical protein n=1 Tax=Baekduia sp. TaxID=2600305 RepID=UPI002D00B4BC|nr:hypothetical protein [Baekduia sp.]HMJ35483.1 hypothetical protein [Baekduia sp.]